MTSDLCYWDDALNLNWMLFRLINRNLWCLMGGNYNLIDIHRFMTGESVDAVTIRLKLMRPAVYSLNLCFQSHLLKINLFSIDATCGQSLTWVRRFVVPHPKIGMSAHFGVDYGEQRKTFNDDNHRTVNRRLKLSEQYWKIERRLGSWNGNGILINFNGFLFQAEMKT